MRNARLGLTFWVLFLGTFAMILWSLRMAGVIVPQRKPKPHAHQAPSLPDPSYPSSGRDQGVPIYPALPAFHLFDTRGKDLRSQDLAETVWIASFLFTNCGGTCSATALRNQVLQSRLPENVLLVSITVDPERDTPEVLDAYGKKFQRDPKRWKMLTGPRAEVEKLLRQGFYLGADGKPIVHTPHLALVDGSGRLRGLYDFETQDQTQELLRDVERIRAPVRGTTLGG